MKETKTGRIPKLIPKENISYRGIHYWIRSIAGPPTECSHCGLSNEIYNIEWANKSGNYLADIDDWISLCTSCHRQYDKDGKHMK